MSNWGNISTAVVTSVSQDKPFNSDTDLQLGIAYIAVFIVSNNLVMYGLGLYRVIGLDFRDDRPETPRTFAGRLQRRKEQLSSLRNRFGKGGSNKSSSSISLRDPVRDPEMAFGECGVDPAGDILAQRPLDRSLTNSEPEIMPLASRQPSTASLDAKVHSGLETAKPKSPEPAYAPPESVGSVVLRRIKAFASPPTISVLVSLLVALVQPIKALFVPVEGWSGSKIGNAPDGGAPLAFLYDVSMLAAA